MEKKFFKYPVTYVGEVQLHVTRLKESLSFYQDIIGFSVLEKSNRKAVLTADGITPLLTIEQPENVVSKQMGRTGLYHFAILLPSRKDLASFLKHCVQYNIPFGSADHAVSEALYLSDPDGNGIEVYHDRPSTEWNWVHDQVTMVTESLDINGILAETSDHWTKLPKETIIGHIHLHVANLQEAKKFYVDGLGLSIVSQYPGALFMAAGNYHHHIAINSWNGEGIPAPDQHSAGLGWFSFIMPDNQAIERAKKCLVELKVPINSRDDYLEVADPSGNTIHLKTE